jgi:rsbT co-antagonist protein RsbR
MSIKTRLGEADTVDKDEWIGSRRRILQTMVGVAGVFALLLLGAVLIADRQGSAETDRAIVITLLTGCVIAWLLARFNQVTLGTHLFFVLLALLTLWASVSVGPGTTSAAVATLFLPIVGATLLLPARWSFAYASLALLVYGVLMITAPRERPDSVGAMVGQYGIQFILYSAYFFIVALLAYLAATRLDRSLAASRRDNAQLAALHESLEQQVAARTVSLQSALCDVQEREARLSEALEHLQQSEMTVRELSAPVLPVLPGVLVLPLIGAVDSARAAVMAEQALRAITERRTRYLVLDVTGVPIIDTQVAALLLRTAEAVRLLGARVVLVGIRPEVAQTLVTLQIDLGGIDVAGDLQQALGALQQHVGR